MEEFRNKASITSLWDDYTKTNKLNIILDSDNQIEVKAILRSDVNRSYNAKQYNQELAFVTKPTKNSDDLLILQVDIFWSYILILLIVQKVNYYFN